MYLINPKKSINMITRRVPDSYRTLNQALRNVEHKLSGNVSDIPFSKESLEAYNNYVTVFRKEYSETEDAKADQLGKKKTTDDAFNKLSIYTRHSIITLNNTIERGEFKESVRSLYHLNGNDNTLPYTNSKDELMEWSENIIEGEEKRIAQGGIPLNFPSLEKLKEAHASYVKEKVSYSDAKSKLDVELEDVQNIFEKGILVVKDIWDEIEFKYRHESAPSRRRKAAEWGVKYHSTQGEEVPEVVEL